ncbi:MAG: Fic family protein [Tannerellaceae bacterium]
MQSTFRITSAIVHKVASISEKIGALNTASMVAPSTQLRKENRIKTIQASLEIEGNTLTVEQITALLDNKRVLAPQKDIQEVKNAIEVYDQLDKFDAFSFTSVCDAHRILMKGLVDNAGRIRTTSVGIVKGNEIAHIAPPAHLVEYQLKELLAYAEDDEDHLLIRSCVFHYEFEFIHPFVDGNGRMGRLWQTVLLRSNYPVFDYLPIETLIKDQQQRYYDTLVKCDQSGDSTLFIEFMLEIIDEALNDMLYEQPVHIKANDRIGLFKRVIGKQLFSRKDYMTHYKDLSSATASRDLKDATEKGLLIKQGEGRTALYQFTE